MTEDADIIFEKHSLHRGFERDAIKKLMREYYIRAHIGDFKDIAEFFEKAKPSLNITVNEMNEIMEEVHSSKRIDPKMIDLILSLKKKYKVALLTNFTSDLEHFLKDIFDVHRVFDVVVNSYDIKTKKPEPGAFHHVLNKLELKPEETVFIDDKEINVEGAKRLGMRGIVYKDFNQTRLELETISK